MRPDATNYDPRPTYMAALIDATGLTQKQIGKLIGHDERTIRRWIAGARTFDYPAQFAVECLMRPH